MRYWTIHGTTALFRHDGRGNFAYVNRDGEWIDRPELLRKVREPDVDAIDRAEAAAIANRRGARL
jgi:hypothetical protein